ncbi:MAG: hypothetical protein LC120_01985 [Bacteroidales bacterium]|nr:hypothetical protein [Bacteroidales bacterium]
MSKSTHKSIHILEPLQADPQTKAAKRVCFFPTQEKLKNKKFPPLQKNKTSQPHNPRQTTTLDRHDYERKEGHPLTRVWRNGG